MRTDGMTDVEDMGTGADYQDTVVLLQDEIARLEEELRLRDEARLELAAVEADPPASEAFVPDPVDANRVAELTAELTRRDETIALLLEEIRLVEEAEAAGRAEWEQLNQWVEQVEQRVDSRDQQETNLEQVLAEERRKFDSLKQTTETERRASESQRRTLEEEVERLRARLSTVAQKTDSNADLALAALEGENRRLRRMCDDLTHKAAAAVEVDVVRAQLSTVMAQIDEAQAKIRSLEDDIERERKEHEVAMAALRSQMAREPLQRREGQAAEALPAGPRDWSQVTADERMQAFRQHLQEVHQREVDERSKNRLSARLSRLWSRTGPTP
jgi:chromosome segregation ATPase